MFLQYYRIAIMAATTHLMTVEEFERLPMAAVNARNSVMENLSPWPPKLKHSLIQLNLMNLLRRLPSRKPRRQGNGLPAASGTRVLGGRCRLPVCGEFRQADLKIISVHTELVVECYPLQHATEMYDRNRPAC